MQLQVIRRSADDKVTVIGAGITLHEVLAAAEDLSNQGELVGAKCCSSSWGEVGLGLPRVPQLVF